MLSRIGSIDSYKYLFLFVPIYGSIIIFPNTLPVVTTLTLIISYILFYLIKNRRKLDLYDGLLMIFSAYVIAISAYWNNLSFGILSSALLLATLPIFIKSKLELSNSILRSLYMIYIMIVAVNFYTLLFPIIGYDGVKDYFIGGKNALAVSLIPAMFFISYYSYVKYNKLTLFNLIFLALTIASLYIGGSSTAAIVATGAIIFLIFLKNIRIKPIIYVISYLVIQLLLFSSKWLNSIPVLADNVEKYFGKDLTFSGRTNVWEIAQHYVSQSFFGYGKGNSIIANNYSSDYGQVLSEAHNMSLEILLAGGIVLLVLFIFIVIGTFSYKGLNNKNILIRLGYFYTFLYFILGLTESVSFRIELWIMFAVIISTNNIIQNEKINPSKAP